LGLDDDARDQRQMMVDLGAPAGNGGLGDCAQRLGHPLQFRPAGLGSGDQVAVELALFVLPAAVFDRTRPFLGQASTVAPADRRRRCRRLAAVQQPRHHPHRIP
jgi:hypothetical protein